MRGSVHARAPVWSLPLSVGLLRGLPPPGVTKLLVRWRLNSRCRPRTDQLVPRRLGGRRKRTRPTSLRKTVLRTRRTAASRSSAWVRRLRAIFWSACSSKSQRALFLNSLSVRFLSPPLHFVFALLHPGSGLSLYSVPLEGDRIAYMLSACKRNISTVSRSLAVQTQTYNRAVHSLN